MEVSDLFLHSVWWQIGVSCFPLSFILLPGGLAWSQEHWFDLWAGAILTAELLRGGVGWRIKVIIATGSLKEETGIKMMFL